MHLDRRIRLFQWNKSYSQKLFYLSVKFLVITKTACSRAFITVAIWFTYIVKSE